MSSSSAATAKPTSSSSSAAKPPAAKRKRIDKTVKLEAELAILEAENHELKLRLKLGKEAVAITDGDEREKHLEALAQALTVGTEEQLVAALKSYTDKFFDYGHDRNEAMTKHMQQFDRLLNPTNITKVCMYCLCQDDEFFTANKPDSLWNVLVKEIACTSEQAEEFKHFRDSARLLTRGLRGAQVEMSGLKERVMRKNKALMDEMKEIQQILSPRQVVKLMLWCSQNPASMAMLTSVWNTSLELPSVPGNSSSRGTT